jgi:Tol biopolymer transport system component
VDTNGTVPAKLTCQSPAISLDGRFAFFDCNATNLTTNAVGQGFHLYRRDLQAGITELIDAGTNGTAPARTTQASSAISADGRFIAFDCLDADLVTNDNNHACDVFLRDLNTETTELISAHEAGLPSRTGFRNGGSDSVTMSADGRYFAFSCQGDALVSNYTNTYFDVFVRDLVAGTNSIVSLDTNGFADANGNSFQPVISADGHYLAFSSYATNLVSNDTNNGSAVFVRDLTAGVTALVSVNSNGIGSLSGNSSSPSISSDGKFVLFLNGGSTMLRDTILATNYVLATSGTTAAAMTPNGRYVAFYGVAAGTPAALHVWDSQLSAMIYTNSTTSVSRLCISSNGQRLAYISSTTISLADLVAGSVTNISTATFVGSAGLHFSADGRWLVYATGTSKSPDDTNGVSDVYLYDAQTGNNSLISRSFYTGKAANGASDSPDISADDRYVVYTSLATDIAPTDGNGRKDIFLYDRQASNTTLLSVSSQVQDSANFVSLRPAFIGDGQTLVFRTWASDLTENDFNQGDDLFVMKIASTNSVDQTNPPPVFVGEIVFVPSGTSQSPRLSWTVASGKTYQAQFKDDLADLNWQPVTGTMVIEGSKESILDLAPNPDHRFYRIVAQ